MLNVKYVVFFIRVAVIDANEDDGGGTRMIGKAVEFSVDTASKEIL